MIDEAFRRFEIEGDRLLAKHGQALVERAADQIGMGPRRRHDHRGIGARECIVDGRRVLGAELLREACRPRRVGIVDAELVDLRQAAQDFGVEGAEPADAEDRDLHSARL